MENLKNRELNTDIKISDYILNNYNSLILFLTHNHPTSYIFINIVNQIYKILNQPLIYGCAIPLKIIKYENNKYDVIIIGYE